MKANHLAVSLLLHAGAIAAVVLLSSAAKPRPETPARFERVTVLTPLASRMRPRLARVVRPRKSSIPVLPVPVAPRPARELHARPFNPPKPGPHASPANFAPAVAILDVAVAQSQNPLSNRPAAVALPPPQLKIGGIAEMQAGAAAGFTSSSTPPRTPGSFGDAKIASQPAHTAAPGIVIERAQSLPVEILSKPRPIYTEEARKLRIQGEVLIEVAFRAAGDVQILRTVRGLGHGLDEAAEYAARQIRFRPARRGESAVDATAVVHIAFELAY